MRGFQWIDGSFVENVESLRARAPEDIDVVTFYYVPDGHTEETLYNENMQIFDGDAAMDKYSLDSYLVALNPENMEDVVSLSAYWYGVWSHTRRGQWKGYLQIDLASAYDADARAELERLEGTEVSR